MFRYKLYMFREVSPKYEMETFKSEWFWKEKILFRTLCVCVEIFRQLIHV